MRYVVAVIYSLYSGAAMAAAPLGAALLAKDWPRAEAEAARAPDKLAPDLVAFCRIIDQGEDDPGVIGALVSRHPSWPRQHALRQSLDAAIVRLADERSVLAACDAYHPESDVALLRCAGAAQATDRHDGPQFARQAWQAGITTPDTEAAFLAVWAHAVTASDQWQRFDALDWAGNGAADRQLARLDGPHRALAAARLALRKGDTAALGTLQAVPVGLRSDPPLLLAWAKWLRGKQRYRDAIDLWRGQAITAEIAVPSARRAAFWHERDRLARLLLVQGDAKDAFFLADDTAVGADDTVDAAFLAGWIALRLLHDADAAQHRFQALAAASPSVITQGRAQYWLAEAAADPAAKSRYLHAASAYPTTFYGQMAITRLADAEGTRAALRRGLSHLAPPNWTDAEARSHDEAELIRAAKLFQAWGDSAHARQFLGHDVTLQHDGPWLAMTAATATQLGLADIGVLAARRAGRLGVVLVAAGWPVPAGFARGDVLALAVARQESNFDPGIVSPSGAQGLMQLLPTTAAELRRGLGQPAASLNLFDPQANVDLGTAYLRKLQDAFGGVLPYAIAAYNAGPRHVREWLMTNGDVARLNDADAMADWIEQIPFGETRNYVQRVLENMAIYGALQEK